jgi:mannose-1-phosphate guanylyltransferase/mannose-6-phosphate isomerase
MIPVVLSGGSGSRLWPLSRSTRPKQFQGVTEQQTLFQLTLERVRQRDGADAPIIVANHEHRFLAAEQARVMGIHPAAIMLEPVGRNTAPAIAVAAIQARADGNDPLILVTPSDHIINHTNAFAHAVTLASEAALEGLLVTFGIVPDRAETGYGYLMAGEELNSSGIHRVARFVEKPDLATAQAYVASGQYRWNSGMFMFRASAFLEELGIHRPDIREAAERAWRGANKDLEFIRLDT